MLHDQTACNERLLRLLKEATLEDAVRRLHGEEGIGLLWIAAAVEVVTGMDGREAKRLVVRATFEMRQRQE